MLKWLGKLVVEKTANLILILLAIGLVVLLWCYRHYLPSPHSVGLFIGCVLLWLALATLLPWATFFVVAWVQKAENNLPAFALLMVWATIDGALAWWLAGDWPRVAQWSVAGLAFLMGGLYNLIAANQIARRLQR